MNSKASGHVVVNYGKLDLQTSTLRVQINEICIGGGESHPMRSSSIAIVQTNTSAIKLKEIRYVPNITRNLISIGALANSEYRVVFSNEHFWIKNTQQ